MRKALFFIFTVVLTTTLIAQNHNSDLCKRRMFYDINQGNYEHAFQEFCNFKLVFELDESDLELDINNFLEFANYTSKQGTYPEKNIEIDSYLGNYAYALAEAFLEENDIYSAIYMYKNSLYYHNNTKHVMPNDYIYTAHALANLYWGLDSIPQAQSLYLKELDELKKLQDTLSITNRKVVLSTLGNIFVQQLDTPQVLSTLNELDYLLCTQPDVKDSVYDWIHWELAFTYSDLKQYDNSVKHYLCLWEKLKRKQISYGSEYIAVANGLSTLYSLKADSFFYANEYEKSIVEYKNALPFTQIIQDTSMYAVSLNNLWEAHVSLNLLNSADSIMNILIQQPLVYHTIRSLGNCGTSVFSRKDYNTAILFYKEKLNRLQRAQTFSHEEYAYALSSLADCYQYQQKLGIADSLNLLSLKYYGQQYCGRYNEDYAFLLSDIASSYLRNKDSVQYLDYQIKAVDYARKYPSSHTLGLLVNLASYYHDVNNILAAERIFLEIKNTLRQQHDTTSKTYYFATNGLARIYKNRNQLAKAKIEFLESIELSKNLYGEHSSTYIYDVALQAYVYMGLRQYQEALNLLNPLANILEKDKDFTKLVDIYIQIASTYQRVPNIDEANRYYEMSLTALETLSKEKSEEYVNVLFSYSLNMYNRLDLFKRRYQIAHLGIELSKSIYGKNSSQYFDFLSVLGQLHIEKAEKEQAQLLFREIIALAAGHPREDSICSNIYNKIGLLYDDFLTREKYFLMALERSKSSSRPFDRASILNNLGLLYSHNRMYAKAEEMFFEAFKLHQLDLDTITGIGHYASYASLLKNISELLYEELSLGWDENKYKQALYYADLALAEFMRHGGYNDLGYAVGLHNKADLLSLKDYEMANNLYIEALNIRRSISGEDSPLCASTYNALGVLHSNNNPKISQNYYEKALQIYLKTNTNPDEVYFNLTLLFFKQGMIEQSISYLQKYFDGVKKNVQLTFGGLTETQREQFWSQYQDYLPNYTHSIVSLSNKSQQNSALSYDMSLFTKGILLDATKQKRRAIESSNDSALLALWTTLIAKQQLLHNLSHSENYSSALATSLENECDSIDKIIAMSNFIPKEIVSWKDVRKQLKRNELAVEFIDYSPYNQELKSTSSQLYFALLLRHDSQSPELIPLFEEKEVSSFLSSSEGNIINQTYDFYSNGDTISQLVWSKILPYINEGETIYFAPSGLLHQLAIEYLPYDENSTMSDVYNMVRLSSTREIVLNKQDTKYTTATIYGGIAYDLEEDVLLAESENYATENLLASRSIENDTLNRGNVKYLPGTKKEAESINTLLKQNNISAKLYTTAKANEESFKALSGKHNNILHIGTHGFTWTDSVAKKQDFFAQRIQLMGQEQYHDTSIDPLNRCGLLFAGANIALQGNSKNLPEGVQDGILTAKEISLLDLRDANLVVLSACETAKGDITSEGVFGLQRAFKMAGVQTIIMSLWKVNDQATQLLMTEFYNNWIGKHQSKREAFRNAQNTVRSQYEEPEYWAGFVMLD